MTQETAVRERNTATHWVFYLRYLSRFYKSVDFCKIKYTKLQHANVSPECNFSVTVTEDNYWLKEYCNYRAFIIFYRQSSMSSF